MEKERKRDKPSYQNEKGTQRNVTTDTKEIETIIREYFRNLYPIKLENLK